MKTRKTLLAENTQLRAQLTAHQHETRKALTQRMKAVEVERDQLKSQLEKALARVVELNMQVSQQEA